MKKTHHKNFLVFLLISFLSNALLAQKPIPDANEMLYTKIAQEVCNCVETAKAKIDLSSNRMQSDSCLSVSAIKYRTELGISNEIPNIITPEIASILVDFYVTPSIIILVKNCNYFFKGLYESTVTETNEKRKEYKKYQEEMRKIQSDTIKSDVDTTMATTDTNYAEEIIPRLTVKGKLEKLETKNYTFLVLKNAEGKEEKFIWLRNFGYDVAEDLAKNFKKYKGKNVILEYGETEVFDAKTKKFVNYREIYALEWE